MSMATRRSNVSSKTMPVVAAIAALLLIVSHDAAADGCAYLPIDIDKYGRQDLTERISDEGLQQAQARMALLLKAEGLAGAPR